MSKILFNTPIDLSSTATPSNGFLIAFDLDGVLKQKDQYGMITVIGATGISPSIPSLSQILAVDNSTVGYDIIMGTGTSIKSNDGNGQIDMYYDGTESHVYISSDSGVLLEGLLEVSNNYSGLSVKNNFMGVESYDISGERVTNLWSTYTSSIVNIGVSKDYYSTYQQYQDISIQENTTYVSVSDYDRHAIFIGTRNSGFSPGITNSVIIGGFSMSATQSNTVYLGNNVNINNSYTLPNTDGASNQVLKTDGAGNVTWQDDLGSLTPTLSEVLLAGNTSSANIILNPGHSIVSSDVSSQTKIQILGGTSTSFFMIDNDSSLLNKAWIVGDSDSFQSGYNDNYLDATDTYISLHSVTGSVIAKVIANSLNNRISIGIADSSATFSNTQDSIEVLNTRTASITTGNTDKWPAVISSKNSSIDAGVINSVIIGGVGITASNNNTVYLGNNVNINNRYTLPNVDGTSGQVLKTDGAGNVTWSSDTTGDLKTVLSNGNTTGTYSINVENYIIFEGRGSTTSITGVATGTPLSGFQYSVTGDLTSEIYSGAKIRVVNTQGGVNDGTFIITNATYSGGDTYFQWSGIVANFVSPYGDIITGIESSYLQVNFASASNLYTLPNKSGTIALLSDIFSSSLINYIPKWVSSTELGPSLIFDDGTNVGIGNNLTSATARLHIKGASSSSATYTIKLDNSAGTGLLYVRDDGYSIINGIDIGRGKQQTSTNLVFGANALENSTGGNNIAIGDNALRNNTTGEYNIAIGHNTLLNSTESIYNIAIGHNTLLNNSDGIYGIAIGHNALLNNTEGSGNIAIGTDALFNNTEGFDNVAIGNNALSSNTTGDENVAIGISSLFNNTTGSGNVAIGNSSLSSNTTGIRNLAIGNNALSSNTTANENVAIGISSLSSNTIGSGNVAIGYQTLLYNTTGIGNVAIGNSSLSGNTIGSGNVAIGNLSLVSNTTGSGNVAIGSESLLNNTVGNENVVIGNRAGYNISTGQYNTAVGDYAMYDLTTGNDNTFIGRNTGLGISDGSANTIMGANVTGLSSSTSNNIILADGDGNIRLHIIANGDTGIGTSNPAYKLDVDGDINTSTKYNVGATAGWTGTFSSGSGEIVTVTGGIITSVV